MFGARRAVPFKQTAAVTLLYLQLTVVFLLLLLRNSFFYRLSNEKCWFYFTQIVSGVPIHNGKRHAYEMAATAVALRRAVGAIDLQHLHVFNDLRVRACIHSGKSFIPHI